MSFNRFFGDRYVPMKKELERLYLSIKSRGEDISLATTAYQAILRHLDGDVFLVIPELGKALELNERNAGQVAAKLLQLLWEDS